MEEILTREKDIASDQFIVGSVPTVFYIPEYVSAAEEDQLLRNVNKYLSTSEFIVNFVFPNFLFCLRFPDLRSSYFQVEVFEE